MKRCIFLLSLVLVFLLPNFLIVTRREREPLPAVSFSEGNGNVTKNYIFIEDQNDVLKMELDDYILGTGEISEETKEKIDRLHKSSRHKYQPMPMFDPEVLYIDSDQLSIDDYADGGLVDPSVTASALAGNAIMTGLDIAAPAAAVNVNINTDYKLEDAIKSIENSIWQSMIKDEIRGI